MPGLCSNDVRILKIMWPNSVIYGDECMTHDREGVIIKDPIDMTGRQPRRREAGHDARQVDHWVKATAAAV
ncbi:hypothetical protein E2C01_023244 [Portunus trituberculatus]|uniref:Uncharacterized protein n=1 Tax=Portunus trituberculatus TaxID=210409 RepID=A0A5B7E7G4_PORTR|nr:hypothetical protein [Portunus trituberculatus]